MNHIDIESILLLGSITYAWWTRRKGLLAVQALTQEQRRVFFREFGPWRWRHYGVLALLILLPGLILYRPDWPPGVLWALGISSFVVTSLHFSLGYKFLEEKLGRIMEDPKFLKNYFADRFPMGLLYILFSFIAMQRAGLLPHFG